MNKQDSTKERKLLGEPGDYFIMLLYCLVEHYSYGDLQDEMIRDYIVVDAVLSEKL